MTEHADQATDGEQTGSPAAKAARKSPSRQARRNCDVIVRGPRLGRWRSGIRFGPEPVNLDAFDLTALQLQAIRNDPMLEIADPERGTGTHAAETS